MNNYVKVNILEDFKSIINIDKLNKLFIKNNWQLLKTKDNLYQLFFGKDVQVNNNFEYGFPYLLDKEETTKELERLINYRLELDVYKIENFKKIKQYCDNFIEFDINDYLYYIGIANVKDNIDSEDIWSLIELCDKFCGEYTNPITISEALTREVFVDKNISLDELKKLSTDDFYEWYEDGRINGDSLRKCVESTITKTVLENSERNKNIEMER